MNSRFFRRRPPVSLPPAPSSVRPPPSDRACASASVASRKSLPKLRSPVPSTGTWAETPAEACRNVPWSPVSFSREALGHHHRPVRRRVREEHHPAAGMEGRDQVGVTQVPREDALGPREQRLDVGGLQLRHPGGEGVVGHDDEGHRVAVAPGALHLAGKQRPERPEVRRLGGSGSGLRQEDRLVVAIRVEALVPLGHLGRAPHQTRLPSQLGESEHVADAAEHRALLQWPLQARLGAGPESAAVGVALLGGVHAG